MPSADQGLRDLMVRYYGDNEELYAGIELEPPLRYLLDRGFKEKDGFIKPPNPSYELNEQERDSIQFLIDEWDFAWGGLPASPP